MLHFGDVAVVVSDAPRSARWYREKVGFRTPAADSLWVTAVVPGSGVVLHLCEATRRKDREKGNTGIGFVAKDVAKEEKRLRAKGVKFTQPTTKEPWGTFAMFADPDGNEFWISEE